MTEIAEPRAESEALEGVHSFIMTEIAEPRAESGSRLVQLFGQQY